MRYRQAERLLVGQVPCALPADLNLDEIPPPPPASAYCEAPPPPDLPATAVSDGVQPTSVRNTPQQPQEPLPDITSHHTSEEHQMSTSNAAGKLASSSSSAQMLSYVLSSLASEGVIGQSMSDDYPSDAKKRPRLNNGGLSTVPCYLPQPQQPPPPPFPHPDSMHQPPLPLFPPTLPPVPPPLPPAAAASPQFGQTAGSTGVSPFTYGPPLVQPMAGFPMVGLPPFPGPPNPYQFRGTDGFFGPPPYPTGLPPISRQ